MDVVLLRSDVLSAIKRASLVCEGICVASTRSVEEITDKVEEWLANAQSIRNAAGGPRERERRTESGEVLHVHATRGKDTKRGRREENRVGAGGGRWRS